MAPSLCACTAFKLASPIETPSPFLVASASTLRGSPRRRLARDATRCAAAARVCT